MLGHSEQSNMQWIAALAAMQGTLTGSKVAVCLCYTVLPIACCSLLRAFNPGQGLRHDGFSRTHVKIGHGLGDLSGPTALKLMVYRVAVKILSRARCNVALEFIQLIDFFGTRGSSSA